MSSILSDGKWFISIFIVLMFMCGCVGRRPVVNNITQEDLHVSGANEEEIIPAQVPLLPVGSSEQEGRPASGQVSQESQSEKQPETVQESGLEEQKGPFEKIKMVVPKRVEEGGGISNLDFREEELRDVLKVFTVLTGKNVVAKENIADLKITIFLKDISTISAIEAICDQYNLWYEETRDYIKVMKLSVRIRMRGDRIAGLRSNDQALCDVLKVFTRETGVNVVANENIKDKKVNLLLKDISPRNAIEVICKKYNLWYEETKDYVRLMKAEDFGKDLSLDCGVKTRIYSLKYASAPQVADAIGCVMGSRIEYNVPGQLKSYEHLKLPDVGEEEGKIEEAKTVDVSVTESVKTEEFEKNLTSIKLEELLGRKLGFRLTAEDIRMVNKELGFALMTVFLRNNCVLASSTSDKVLDEIEEIINQLDIPTPQVLLECKILKVRLSDDFSSFFNIKYAEIGTHHDIKMDILHKGILEEFPLVGGTSIVYNFISPDNYKFDIAMEILEKDGVVEITSTPMVVAAQNAEAEFFSGYKEWPFVKGINYREVQEQAGVGVTGQTRYYIDVDTKLDDVGTKLKVTPQINEDNTVTLRIHIEESTARKKCAEVPFWNPAAGEDKKGALVDYSVDVKEVNNIDTIITVPKDYTLALGGLVNEESSKEEEKVPFLGDIPLLGFFFKDQKEIKERNEIVFLLTPHVMINPLEVEKTSKKVLKDSRHPDVN